MLRTLMFAVTPAQLSFLTEKGFWNLNHRTIYVQHELAKRISYENATRIVQELHNSHTAFSSRFMFDEGRWTQVKVEAADVPILSIDLSYLSEEEQEAEINEISKKMGQSLDIKNGPLFRAAYVWLGHRKPRLLSVFHHLITDGFSLSVYRRDLIIISRIIIHGELPSHRAPRIGSDFLKWCNDLHSHQKSEACREAAYHWLSQPWEKCTKLLLPAINGMQQPSKGVAQVSVVLGQGEAAHTVSNAALCALFHAEAERLDNRIVCISVVRHGRTSVPKKNTARSIGCYLDVSPLLVDLRRCVSIKDEYGLVLNALNYTPTSGISMMEFMNEPEIDSLGQAAHQVSLPVVSFNFLPDIPVRENPCADEIREIPHQIGYSSDERNDGNHYVWWTCVYKASVLDVSIWYSHRFHMASAMQAQLSNFVRCFKILLGSMAD